jgi:molecular chaperone DnaK (HSP70)
MKLGIDFGTTRIVVATADRGNYPLLSFEMPDGVFEWFPPLVAIRGSERRYGWDAWHAQGEAGWLVLRSLKRYLEDAGPETMLEVGGVNIPLVDLLHGVTSALRDAIRAQAGARAKPDEPLEVMLGVPANANSNQRFLTVDAFRRAGFSVLGLLNEPSAASIEFGHKQRDAMGRILIYDLGGGTFDVSLVEKSDKAHTVLASEGISTLGGDDFDQILAEMAVGGEALRLMNDGELFRLEEECRRQKETLHPNSRKIVIDLDVVRDDMGETSIPVADFYDRCRPLVEATIEATMRLAADEELEALYVTGGASELPLVSRMLREEFGRKVKRSEYTRSATAIGLAIQAGSGYTPALREMFTRDFGVWREADAGRRMVFDPIFPRGTRLPGPGEPPHAVSRRYQPVHNVGHFRYLEASHINGDDQPAGDYTVWDEVLFPFDPVLADQSALDAVPVLLSDRAAIQEVEEVYECDSAGSVAVSIHNLTAHYKRDYKLGRWSAKPAVVKASARRGLKKRKAGK